MWSDAGPKYKLLQRAEGEAPKSWVLSEPGRRLPELSSRNFVAPDLEAVKISPFMVWLMVKAASPPVCWTTATSVPFFCNFNIVPSKPVLLIQMELDKLVASTSAARGARETYPAF